MTPHQSAETSDGPMSTVHAHYKRNGYESCPTCGAWLGAQPDRGSDA